MPERALTILFFPTSDTLYSTDRESLVAEHYLYVNGEQCGPYSESDIRAWLVAGRISREDYLYDGDGGQWITLGSSFLAVDPAPIAAASQEPQPAEVEAPPFVREISADEIAAAFTEPIPPVRVSALYRFALSCVALAMIALPLLYLGLILLTAYGVFLWGLNGLSILEPFGVNKLTVMIYLGPIIGGIALPFFMIKPIFAGAPKAEKPRSLTREEQPALFALVEAICRTVRAPLPRRIDVDCQINASAGYRRGFFSMLTNDLVLTIGLPLVEGLSLRQFAGVLAHEFGHFAQGTGMRVTYIVRTISAWFSRVVYQDDSWDMKLSQAGNRLGELGCLLIFIPIFVTITRKILWCFMMAGHAMSCFALRQMEFDADRYECRIAGSRTFAETVESLRHLGEASLLATNSLRSAWTDGRLGNNYPLLVREQVGKLPKRITDEIKRAVQLEKTDWFDTHPADPDRIRSALAEDASGIIPVDAPATAVFQNLPALAKEMTFAYYRDFHGLPVTMDRLVSTDEVLERERALTAAWDEIHRYFMKAATIYFPLTLSPSMAEPAPDAKAAVQYAIAEGEALEPQRQEILSTVSSLHRRIDRIEALAEAKGVLSAGIPIAPESFDLKASDFNLAQKQFEAARADYKSDLESLRTSQRALTTRLHWALTAAAHAETAGSIANLLTIYVAVAGESETIWRLREAMVPVTTIANNLQTALPADEKEAQQQFEYRKGRLQAIFKRLRAELLTLSKNLANVPYPFEHAEGDIMVGRFIIRRVPREDEWDELMNTAQFAHEQIVGIHDRLLGTLAVIARKAERGK